MKWNERWKWFTVLLGWSDWPCRVRIGSSSPCVRRSCPSTSCCGSSTIPTSTATSRNRFWDISSGCTWRPPAALWRAEPETCRTTGSFRTRGVAKKSRPLNFLHCVPKNNYVAIIYLLLQYLRFPLTDHNSFCRYSREWYIARLKVVCFFLNTVYNLKNNLNRHSLPVCRDTL